MLIPVFHTAAATHRSIAYAIWHSSKSDAAQRDMLTAALKASIAELKLLPTDAHNTFQQKVFEEYFWIVKEIGKLSHDRNDLIHSPIALSFASGAQEFEAVVTDVYSNPRAAKMVNKELFQLCRWLIAFCEEMSRYVAQVNQAVRLDEKLPPRLKPKPKSDFPTRRQPPVRSKRLKSAKRKGAKASAGRSASTHTCSRDWSYTLGWTGRRCSVSASTQRRLVGIGARGCSR